MGWGTSVRTRVLSVTRQSVSSGLLNSAAGEKVAASWRCAARLG